MRHLCFSVFDDKTGCFDRPFYGVAVGQAARMFSDAVNKEDSPFYKHPSDFRLYHVGYFDDEVGAFESITPASLVCVGSDCVEPGSDSRVVSIRGKHADNLQ